MYKIEINNIERNIENIYKNFRESIIKNSESTHSEFFNNSLRKYIKGTNLNITNLLSIINKLQSEFLNIKRYFNTKLSQEKILNKNLINQLTSIKQNYNIKLNKLSDTHNYKLIEQRIKFKNEITDIKSEYEQKLESTMYCSICNKHFKNKKIFDAHPKSKIHLNNLKTLYQKSFSKRGSFEPKIYNQSLKRVREDSIKPIGNKFKKNKINSNDYLLNSSEVKNLKEDSKSLEINDLSFDRIGEYILINSDSKLPTIDENGGINSVSKLPTINENVDIKNIYRLPTINEEIIIN